MDTIYPLPLPVPKDGSLASLRFPNLEVLRRIKRYLTGVLFSREKQGPPCAFSTRGERAGQCQEHSQGMEVPESGDTGTHVHCRMPGMGPRVAAPEDSSQARQGWALCRERGTAGDPGKQCFWQEYTERFVQLGMPVYREPVSRGRAGW